MANTIWETQIAYTYNLNKEDVVIIISNSGASKRVLDVAKAAIERGANTIGITNSDNSPLAKICNYHIKQQQEKNCF